MNGLRISVKDCGGWLALEVIMGPARFGSGRTQKNNPFVGPGKPKILCPNTAISGKNERDFRVKIESGQKN